LMLLLAVLSDISRGWRVFLSAGNIKSVSGLTIKNTIQFLFYQYWPVVCH